MARTRKNGYELLLFLEEKEISLEDAREIIAQAQVARIEWNQNKEKAVIKNYEKRGG